MLAEWADEILQQCVPIAEVLDTTGGGAAHREAVAAATMALRDTRRLPSARVLDTMARDFGGSYIQFVRGRSASVKQELLADPWPPELEARHRAWAAESSRAQREAEASDRLPFEDFRQRYLDPSQLTPSGA